MAAKVEVADTVKVTVKKADSVSDGNNGFLEVGAVIDVSEDTAQGLKDKGLA